MRIAVFASGGGTNLQAILDHFAGPASDVARVALVISDRADAGALERARDAGVSTEVIPVTGRTATEVARDSLAALERAGVGLIALAGYLRLVPAEVVRAYRDRILNIHPSLLSAFGGKGMYGLRIHRAVIEAGCRVSGLTVHIVDEAYDRGPILVQWPVPVLEGDTPEALGARVLRVEHRIYPLVLEAAARAAGGGEPVRPFRLPDDVAYSLVAGEAPPVAVLREALGLE